MKSKEKSTISKNSLHNFECNCPQFTRDPIFTIGLSRDFDARETVELSKQLDKKLTGYHVLVYSTDSEETKFGLYNPAEADTSSIEEIKKTIRAQMLGKNLGII